MEYCYHVSAGVLDHYLDMLEYYLDITWNPEPSKLCYWSFICCFSSPAGNHCNVVIIGQFYRYASRTCSSELVE